MTSIARRLSKLENPIGLTKDLFIVVLRLTDRSGVVPHTRFRRATKTPLSADEDGDYGDYHEAGALEDGASHGHSEAFDRSAVHFAFDLHSLAD